MRSAWVSSSRASDQLRTAGSHSLRPGAPVGVALTRAVRVADGVSEGLADADAVAVGVGEATLDGAVGVYSALDRVSVEPAVTYSRIGDNGGPIAKQPAVFDAIGWLNGPDGQPETGDDIRIGAVPAEWVVDNFDVAAVAAEDTKFAG